MRSSYAVTTGPASEPITLTEAKNHLKVDFSADDDLITALIVAAREEAESYTNRKLLPQTITEKFDAFAVVDPVHNPGQHLVLSASPLRAITSIAYKDENGSDQTLSSATYITHDYEMPPRVGLAYGQSWPSTYSQDQSVTVTYTVGYDDADSVPAAIKQAMLLIIGFLYDNRQDSVSRLPTASEKLLWKYRVIY